MRTASDRFEGSAAMQLGRLLLRVTVGEVFVVHGSQKLFGAFGGHGPEGTGQFFDSLGLRPGKRNALAAGGTETVSGTLLILGLATPAAAAGLTAVMLTALRTAIWKEGPKPATGEFEVLLAGAALTLADIGPGPWSLDAARGRERQGPGWALAALAAGAAGSALAVAAGRREPQPPAPPEATPRRRRPRVPSRAELLLPAQSSSAR
jgi:putative oxidoreductase